MCVHILLMKMPGLIIAATNASSYFQCGNPHFQREREMSFRFQFCHNIYIQPKNRALRGETFSMNPHIFAITKSLAARIYCSLQLVFGKHSRYKLKWNESVHCSWLLVRFSFFLSISFSILNLDLSIYLFLSLTPICNDFILKNIGGHF